MTFACTFVHIQAKLGQENFLRMVRWMRWHCPLDTGFERRALAVWGRARYLSSRSFTSGWGRNIFASFKPPRPGNELRTWKAAVLTTTLGPRPGPVYTHFNNNTSHSEQRWTVSIRQLSHISQWQHATQWVMLHCTNQTTVHAQTRASSLLQAIHQDGGGGWRGGPVY